MQIMKNSKPFSSVKTTGIETLPIAFEVVKTSSVLKSSSDRSLMFSPCTQYF